MKKQLKLNTVKHSNNRERLTQQKNSETETADIISPNFNNKCVELSITKHQDTSEVVNFNKKKARAFKVVRELNILQEDEKKSKEKLITDYLSVCKEDGGMTIVSLQQLAMAIGVESPEKITQTTELIRLIQKASQQRSCFQSNYYKLCHDQDCIWSTECKKLIAEWMR